MRAFLTTALLAALALGGCSSSESKPAEGEKKPTPPRSSSPSTPAKGGDPLAPSHEAPSRPADSALVHDVTPVLSACSKHGDTVSDICPTCKQAVSPR